MDDIARAKIISLADDYSRKKAIFDCRAMANAHGKTFEESKKQASEYHLAQAEMLEAWAKLETAKMPVPPALSMLHGDE